MRAISIEQARKMSKAERKTLLDRIEKMAFDNEVTYFGCSQVVLNALQTYLDIGDGGALKSASALAGGVAAMRETCGALLGAVMGVGLAYGRAKVVDGKIGPENIGFLEARLRSAKLCQEYKKKFGSFCCKDVMKAVGRKDFPRFDTLEAFEDHAKCANVTGFTARAAAEILLEPSEAYADRMNELLADFAKIREEQKKQRR
jgi:C_GCAxxG_C_C family probable redox protein